MKSRTIKTLKFGAAIGLGLALLGGCQSKETPIEMMEAAMATAKASSGDGDPAMWLLSDEDTKVYMFGTVHILPDGINWRTAKFDEVIASADTLVLETDVSPEAQAASAPIMMQYAMNEEGDTLTGLLGDDVDVVVAAFDKLGVPMENLDGFKPWMGTVSLQMMSLMNDGYNVESGIETILAEDAKVHGLEMGYLETVEEQLQFISGGTMESQVDALVFTAQTMDLGKEVMDTIVGEWVDGDVAGMGAIIASPSSLGSQDMYDRLLIQRNTNWVPQIEDMLDTPGTVLVAVGAAHLAGPDSVITMLENKGHTIQVVQ